MNFQDNEKNSVQSLLALLRSTQDGGAAATIPPEQPAPGPSSQRPTRISNRTLSRSTSGILAGSATGTAVPSTQQLNDLLRSLNPPPLTSQPSSNRPLASPSSTSKASRNLIEPFGPITNLTNPSAASRTSGTSRPTQSFTERDAEVSTESNAEAAEASGKDEERGMMSFAKALPRLGEMMGDERFMSELRKMKADQDALERRLWAKQEKIKAEHERSIQAERDIARIAQRPIPAEKKAQWAATLDLTLRDFHLQTCLPSLDSLSKRQKARLEEIGVPGLGGDAADEKTVARWRKIMDLLQAGLEE